MKTNTHRKRPVQRKIGELTMEIDFLKKTSSLLT